jgi:hypothetical protein
VLGPQQGQVRQPLAGRRPQHPLADIPPDTRLAASQRANPVLIARRESANPLSLVIA